MDRYPLMDLFAGCGGMTLGFEQTGRFESVFAVEHDRGAAETYRRNFGDHVVQAPIETVREFPKARVVIGGPPCQGFSPLNMRGVRLERRALWRHYLRALRAADADFFVMENVPQLLVSDDYVEFAEEAHRLGYWIREGILNAADFGVPQRRKRTIVIGSRQGDPPWPQASHHCPDRMPLGGHPWRTFGQAVAGLPLRPDGDNWHTARNPTPLSIERYKVIPWEGEGRRELAERRPDITPPCWLRKDSGSTDVFGRLWWDRPAYTLRTEFTKPEKGRYLHPSEHRAITVREGARCMSFPDDFELPAEQSMTSVTRQIGNAVPPLFARAIANVLIDQLDGAARENAVQLVGGCAASA